MFRCSIAVLFTALFVTAMTVSSTADKADEKEKAKSPLAGEMKLLGGKKADLADYKGKVVLIVNTASYCGNTPQYAGLEELYKKYKDKEFVVLGFPANEFGKQEPGTDEEIAQFCSSKYNVSFPMFSKIVVKGDGQAPAVQDADREGNQPEVRRPGYLELREVSRGPRRTGRRAIFAAHDEPESEEVVKAIETEIEKKKS